MTTRVEYRNNPPSTVPFNLLKRGECFQFCSGATPAMRVANEIDPGPHYMFLAGTEAFMVNRISLTTQIIPIDAHIIVG